MTPDSSRETKLVLVCYGPSSKCELVNQTKLSQIIKHYKHDHVIIAIDAGIVFDLSRALKETERK